MPIRIAAAEALLQFVGTEVALPLLAVALRDDQLAIFLVGHPVGRQTIDLVGIPDPIRIGVRLPLRIESATPTRSRGCRPTG